MFPTSIVPPLLLLLLHAFSGVEPCPPQEALLPLCHCKHLFGDNMMFCSGAMNPEELISPLSAPSSYGVEMYSLAIENSSLLYLPGHVFNKTTFQKIRFVRTQLMSLSDSDRAFRGLEDTLIEIRATDAHYIAQWDWQQLRDLRKLDLIDVNYISMGSVDEPFPALKSLRILGIINAEISFLVNYAFAALPNLTILILKGNAIKDITRTMLPKPADKLTILDLSDNRLESLPENFFYDMPALQDVKLDKNKFVALSEKSFKWALLNLHYLSMEENDIRCDCRMRWLVDIRYPYTFLATCASPENLAGVYVKYLSMKSLVC